MIVKCVKMKKHCGNIEKLKKERICVSDIPNELRYNLVTSMSRRIKTVLGNKDYITVIFSRKYSPAHPQAQKAPQTITHGRCLTASTTYCREWAVEREGSRTVFLKLPNW